jgi:hypothetical protein
MQNIADKVFTEKHCFILVISLATVLMMALAPSLYAQRASVSVSEVTGTFRHNFTGKFKGSSNEIKIASAGRGKLRIAMELMYPYMVGRDLSANTGELDGEAAITGDTAVYKSTEFGPCEITIKFTKPGVIDVQQSGSDADCGFGHNVVSSGRYTKVSGRKPNFSRDH